MAFDGVFAFQGKDHITASQLGRIVEGVAGKGRYVLPTLNQMTAEMQTANKVRVGTGDLVMDGRVVTNEAAVDLTVESGMSGYKRNDLVVCRYTKNASTGVEKFAAEVVKGTPTTGTAADPKVTEGDISSGSASAVMPLWRIPLNGITPGAPVRIAPVASTLKTLGDSVSQLTSNMDKKYTQTIYSGSDGYVKLEATMHIAMLSWDFEKETMSLWNVGTINGPYRPTGIQYTAPSAAYSYLNGYPVDHVGGYMYVKTDGSVIFKPAYAGTGISQSGCMAWPAN